MPDKLSKGDALLKAIRETDVGSNVIIHNSNGCIWCILRVVAKEHPEDKDDDGVFIYPTNNRIMGGVR